MPPVYTAKNDQQCKQGAYGAGIAGPPGILKILVPVI